MHTTRVRLVPRALFLVTSLALGCAPTPSDATGETADPLIFGTNDLRLVDASVPAVPSRYAPLYRGFGYFRRSELTGNSYDNHQCTATYIGKGVAMTAGHCFGATSSEQSNVICPGTVVQWAAITGAPEYLPSACQRVLKMRDDNNGTDYAFFEVFPQPDTIVQVNTSAGSGSAAPSRATIFSHPAGRLLSWSGTCALTTPYGTIFPHQCDTEGGSSGAAVLDDSTLRAVGINMGNDSGILNYGRYLSATPAASVLANRAAWRSGVTVLSSTTTLQCAAAVGVRNDLGPTSRQCNGRRDCSVTGAPPPTGCTATQRSITYRCSEGGATISTATNSPATIASRLTCAEGATVDPPSWTLFVSEEYSSPQTSCEGLSGNRPESQAVDGMGCRGGYCDDVSLRCPSVAAVTLAHNTAYWTAPFSEENAPMTCASGYYVSAARCTGSSCDNLALRCEAGNRAWGTCSWTARFSEEQSSMTCPAGALMAGAQCFGRYCDDISLYCCTPR